MPTYITIDDAGVRIHEYVRGDDDRDLIEEAETDSALAQVSGEKEDAEYENVGS